MIETHPHQSGGQALPLTHLLLALLIVTIWGTNFVVIHIGLAHFHALTLATLRFAIVSLPLLPFTPWPRAKQGAVIVYGLLIGVGQFGLMLMAMQGHISPGLASLLIQAQAFVTVFAAAIVSGERLRLANIAGLGLCAIGITLVAVFAGGDADRLGIILVLGAALTWGLGNFLAHRMGPVNPISLIVWSNLFAIPPLAMAAVWVDGGNAIYESLLTASSAGWAAALWQSFANALFSYGAWNWLLARHPATRIAPLGMLVPFFGLGASAFLLGEALPPWKIIAGLIVVTGLAINILARPRATFNSDESVKTAD